MLLRCKCPSCGETKEYIAEQVGSTLDCFRCGHRFELKGNPARVAWHIIAATLVVLAMIGAVLGRAYKRSHRWEHADRDRQTHTFTITLPGSDD
jgi:hypothetical protein